VRHAAPGNLPVLVANLVATQRRRPCDLIDATGSVP
jgi:hypothetical protein